MKFSFLFQFAYIHQHTQQTCGFIQTVFLMYNCNLLVINTLFSLSYFKSILILKVKIFSYTLNFLCIFVFSLICMCRELEHLRLCMFLLVLLPCQLGKKTIKTVTQGFEVVFSPFSGSVSLTHFVCLRYLALSLSLSLTHTLTHTHTHSRGTVKSNLNFI